MKDEGINLNVKLTKGDYKKLSRGKKLIIAQAQIAGKEITVTLQRERS